MKFYLAPMEGLTGYIFRNAYNETFGDVDRYFTPFLASKKLNHKEKNDVLPEHNIGMEVVPQILTNRADEFISIAEQLDRMGYKEVNLNLGCPSGTVVAKNRGAGFLGVPKELIKFLDEIFLKSRLPISVKTRIGMTCQEEWENLIEIFNRYPLTELIIHPRLRIDFYEGKPRYDAFKLAVEKCDADLCYNGDIKTADDYNAVKEMFPSIQKIMIGRGVLENPGLIGTILGRPEPDADTLRSFHDKILTGYCEIMSGDRNVLFKMKEFWVHFGKHFPDTKKEQKAIQKSNSVDEYKAAVNMIL